MREKIRSYLGFSKKSKNLVSGYHACLHGIRQGRVKLLIVAEDLSDGTRSMFQTLAGDRSVPIRIYGTKQSLSELANETNRGIYGITEEHLADAIKAEIDQERSVQGENK